MLKCLKLGKLSTPNINEDMKELTLSSTDGEDVKWSKHLEDSMVVS